jgi:hypothetical protein
MKNKNGVYLGKCITFRNNWDFLVACAANEAAKGDARIVFNWRGKPQNCAGTHRKPQNVTPKLQFLVLI